MAAFKYLKDSQIKDNLDSFYNGPKNGKWSWQNKYWSNKSKQIWMSCYSMLAVRKGQMFIFQGCYMPVKMIKVDQTRFWNTIITAIFFTW